MQLNNIQFSNGLLKPTDQNGTENTEAIGEKMSQSCSVLCLDRAMATSRLYLVWRPLPFSITQM